jgi:hypothetical protein
VTPLKIVANPEQTQEVNQGSLLVCLGFRLRSVSTVDGCLPHVRNGGAVVSLEFGVYFLSSGTLCPCVRTSFLTGTTVVLIIFNDECREVPIFGRDLVQEQQGYRSEWLILL